MNQDNFKQDQLSPNQTIIEDNLMQSHEQASNLDQYQDFKTKYIDLLTKEHHKEGAKTLDQILDLASKKFKAAVSEGMSTDQTRNVMLWAMYEAMKEIKGDDYVGSK